MFWIKFSVSRFISLVSVCVALQLCSIISLAKSHLLHGFWKYRNILFTSFQSSYFGLSTHLARINTAIQISGLVLVTRKILKRSFYHFVYFFDGDFFVALCWSIEICDSFSSSSCNPFNFCFSGFWRHHDHHARTAISNSTLG